MKVSHGVVPTRAEAPASFGFRVGFPPASGDELLDAHREMEPELVVDVGIAPLGAANGKPERASHARPKEVEHGPWTRQAVRGSVRIAVTTAA
jgi:hypothetical protein